MKSVTVNGTEITLDGENLSVAGYRCPGNPQTANAAWHVLRTGGSAETAFVVALTHTARPDTEWTRQWGREYEDHTILNTAAGRCPDGCCGAGMDFPGTRESDALDAAFAAARGLI